MGKPLSLRCEKSTGPEERGLAIDDFTPSHVPSLRAPQGALVNPGAFLHGYGVVGDQFNPDNHA